MLPYHPNSDALPPPPALPPLPAEPVFPLPLSEDLVFALAVFVLFFFSVLESDCSSLDFGRLDFAWADDLDAFANTVFLGVGLAVGFGVAFVLSRPALKILTQRMGLKLLWAPPHRFLIFRPRDLPHHSTKPSFPYLARFALLRSSELILRSARDGRAQLA
ncbi:MAG: hypothetical protein DME55_00260 [Verrucomicrobia bacterium]|nr:MAG: hypothetical protein DME55_00260 [Verrucomicrobiota bacterium]